MAVAIEEGYTCNARVRTWVSEAEYEAKYTSQELFLNILADQYEVRYDSVSSFDVARLYLPLDL